MQERGYGTPIHGTHVCVFWALQAGSFLMESIVACEADCVVWWSETRTVVLIGSDRTFRTLKTSPESCALTRAWWASRNLSKIAYSSYNACGCLGRLVCNALRAG